MVRPFLDANVLLPAANRIDAGLLQLWKLKHTILCSSRYALEEARLNLDQEAQRSHLIQLAEKVELFDAAQRDLPRWLSLPEKDVPIIQAAMVARATHLLTGDLRHFGPYFGRKVEGILIVPPADYLKQRTDET